MPPVIDPAALLSLPSLIEAAAGPSPFLDARLCAWAGLPAGSSPTASMEAADTFCQAVSPDTTWVMKGSDRESVASITSLGGAGVTVLYTGRAGRPALALLAAFVRAVEGSEGGE